ncbi:MAG TPA: pyrimidine/purine nucleoside phosphorylase [Sphingobacteriaceae bacterium]|nr:pyrimidine/purine nucleoside phosphorylase [Sphingobacteriaceae bacterium]
MITVNEYFGGSVKSLGYQSKEGKSTIGIIEKGEYEFDTSMHETMYIIEGELHVQLSATSNWEIFSNGQTFEVPANSLFKVKTTGQTSYLCKYK